MQVIFFTITEEEKMKALLKIEFVRIFRSKQFLCALLIGCTITVIQFLSFALPCIEYLDSFDKDASFFVLPHTWLEKWIGGELVSAWSYLYYLVIPIIAVLPNSMSLFSDRKSGYYIQIESRNKKRLYYFAKYISTFISSGIAVIIPLILNLLLSAAVLPSIASDPSTGTAMIGTYSMWSEFYYAHPFIYTFIYLFIDFLFSGLFGIFGLAIGRYSENNFLTFMSPFILYFVTFTITTSLNTAENNITKFSPFYYLSPAQRGVYNEFGVIVVEFAALMIITLIIYIIGEKTDEGL